MIGYRTSSDLPLPAEWDPKPFYAYRYALTAAGAAAFLLLLLAGALFGIVADDERPPLVVSIGLLPVLAAAFLGYAVNAWLLWPRTAEAAVAIEGAALKLPVRKESALGPIAAVVGGLYLVALGVFVLVAMLSTNPQTGFLLFAVLAGTGGAAIFLAYLSRQTDSADTGILLSPTDVVTEFGAGPITIAWQDISAIHAGSHRSGSGWWRTNVNTIAVHARSAEGADVSASAPAAIEITHKQLATDPTRFYHLLSFYLRNPALRPELGAEAGADRFRSGRYGTNVQ
ncbi:hypothetical protein [Nocardia sp. NPDC048505]|uniref:hypothetical protein n=1 Tax=unclassified Nocardia TaxID=2637762 RepID=UPI0033FCFE1C